MLSAHFDNSRFDEDLLGGTHGVTDATGESYQVSTTTQAVIPRNTRQGCILSKDNPKYTRKNSNTARDTVASCERTAPGACDVPSLPSTLHSASSLTVPCDRCEDGVAFHGNDPSGGVVCEICDGAGVLERCCELCGERGATDWICDRPYHLECAEEVLADMYRVIERAVA